MCSEQQRSHVPASILQCLGYALQDHVLLKMPPFERYDCHDGLLLKYPQANTSSYLRQNQKSYNGMMVSPAGGKGGMTSALLAPSLKLS